MSLPRKIIIHTKRSYNIPGAVILFLFPGIIVLAFFGGLFLTLGELKKK